VNLDDAKTKIHLPNFAGQHGWMIDRAGGIGRSVQMRRSGGSDEIVISREAGRWVYFRRDASSAGTIIDFCQKELGLSWHETIKTLAEAISNPPAPAAYLPFPTANRRSRNPAAPPPAADCRPYLESRGITPATLEHFCNSIDDGPGGAVQFPHTGGGGEGHEYRGPRSRGFSAGGRKGFWLAKPATATALVICESGIDCLSYAQAHGLPEWAAYASTGGGCGPEVIRALVDEARTMPQGIVIATDRDAGGERLALAIEEAAQAAGVPTRRDQPASGKDWNEALQFPSKAVSY
jgi:hypothetical protein